MSKYYTVLTANINRKYLLFIVKFYFKLEIFLSNSVFIYKHLQFLIAMNLCFRNIEESIGRPLFVIFRNLVQMQDGNASSRPLLQVLVEMNTREQRIGYLMMYFLKAR
jgi:hypothetical protein